MALPRSEPVGHNHPYRSSGRVRDTVSTIKLLQFVPCFGRIIEHYTVHIEWLDTIFQVVILALLSFLLSSWEMNGKAHSVWRGTSPCKIKLTVELRANALRAYEGKCSRSIPPGPRSQVCTSCCSRISSHNQVRGRQQDKLQSRGGG